jgi:hypothetical protein
MRNKPVFPNLRNVKGVITPEGEALTLKTCESCVPAALRGGRLFLCLWDLIPVLLASPGLRFDRERRVAAAAFLYLKAMHKAFPCGK